MPTYQVSLNFTQGKYDWSEQFGMDSTGLSPAIEKTKLMLPLRRTLLVTAGRITGYSVTDMNDQRLSRVKTLTAAEGVGAYPVLAQAGSEPPYSSLYLSCHSTGNRFRQMHLRGIPTEIVDSEGVYTPAGAYTVLLNAYIAAAKLNFRLLFQLNDTERNITTLQVAGALQDQLTVGYDGAAINLLKNDLVQLVGVKVPRYVNKIVKVAVAAAASPVTIGPFGQALAGVWNGTGLFREKGSWSTEAFEEIQPIRGAKRATGGF